MNRIVYVVNRTTVELEATDDGKPWRIRPGYKRVPRLIGGEPALDENDEPIFDIIGAAEGGRVAMEPMSYFAAERAKRQNPVMGTQDPYNPARFVSMIAVPDWGDDYSHIEQTDALEVIDRSLLPADRQAATVGRMDTNAPFRAPGRAKLDRSAAKASRGGRPVVLRTGELGLTGMLGDNGLVSTR